MSAIDSEKKWTLTCRRASGITFMWAEPERTKTMIRPTIISRKDYFKLHHKLATFSFKWTTPITSMLDPTSTTTILPTRKARIFQKLRRLQAPHVKLRHSSIWNRAWCCLNRSRATPQHHRHQQKDAFIVSRSTEGGCRWVATTPSIIVFWLIKTH